jgi:hypothetical protein
MSNVGIGDVFFILLILGVVHGIMHLVDRSRQRKSAADKLEDDSPNRSPDNLEEEG